MILPRTRRRLMKALKKQDKGCDGKGMGGNFERRFIRESIANLEASLEF